MASESEVAMAIVSTAPSFALPLGPLLRNRSVIFGPNLTDCEANPGLNTVLCSGDQPLSPRTSRRGPRGDRTQEPRELDRAQGAADVWNCRERGRVGGKAVA